MRRYKRMLVTMGLLLMAVFFITSHYLMPLLHHRSLGTVDFFQHENKQESIVYALPEKNWLEFPFQSVDYLKILTNANVPEQSKLQQAQLIKTNSLTPEDYWDYALEYQVLNDKKEILQQKTYYHHTRLTIYQDKNGKQYTNANYADLPNIIAADGRFVMVNVSDLLRPRYFRIRLSYKNPLIQHVSIRVYAPLQVAEHKLEALWLRINQQAKELLAEGSVYNAALLSNEEKRNLLKHRWQPLGPSGIQDRDYTSRLLYSYQDIEDAVLSEPVYPLGLLLDKQHRVVIPVAEPGMDLRLQYQLLDNHTPITIPLGIHWFGKKITDRWHKQISWQSNAPQDYAMKAMPGFIELSSQIDTPVLVKVYQGKAEITPLLSQYIKSYIASVGQPLEFNVVHNGTSSTAMRLDIRQILIPQPKEKPNLSYQWLDKTGKVIKQGSLLANNTVSLYDTLANQAFNTSVSNPASYYFEIPAEITRLRLQLNQGTAFISAYNRYDGFVKINQVPEDFYVSIAEKNLNPAWFSVNPTHWQTLLVQNRQQLIAAQYRPPEDDLQTQQLLQGIYDWQELLPVAVPPAQITLQAKEDKQPIRQQALDNNYCSLPLNQNIAINLQTYAHLTQIKADLVFNRHTTQAFKMAVWLDNKLFHQTEQMGTHGLINLPVLSSGTHQIRIVAPSNTQVFMNNIANCKSNILLKRRIYPISTQNKLRFIYNKTKAEDEVLSAHFYTTEIGNRAILKVNIHSGNATIQRSIPSLNWTFLNRQFDLRLQTISTGFFLYDWHQKLAQEQVFFIPLQSDLKIGEYQIEMSLPQGTGYLTLNKTQAGFYENYKFYHQTGLQEIEY